MAKTIERSALVTYTPVQMFELVDDIERYPGFMDGCVGAEVLVEHDHVKEARLDLRKGKLDQSFVTRNTAVPGERIDMTLVRGPFEKLDGYWLFEAVGESGCRVSLTLTFEFKSKFLAMAAGSWFEAMGNNLVDAVCAEARRRYGR